MSALATVPELVPAGTAIVKPPRPSWSTQVVARLGRPIVRTAISVVSLAWLLPMLGLLVTSLRSTADNSASGWWTVFTAPGQLTLRNYVSVLSDPTIAGSLWNTILITVPATLLVVGLSALAAYALAWVDFRGRDVMFVVVVALNVVPVQAAIIPDATIFRHLGIYGQIAAVVLFHVAFGLPFGVFLLRNFFIGIPRDLLEAARSDGASEAQVFLRIVLPIGWPAVMSLAVFEFLWVWNDLLVALVFATSDNAPITYTLREQTRAFSSNLDVIGPGSLLSMLVPLLVFFVFQRYFVRSVLDGSGVDI
jgi:alpha-glucoside transport system permease protein